MGLFESPEGTLGEKILKMKKKTKRKTFREVRAAVWPPTEGELSRSCFTD